MMRTLLAGIAIVVFLLLLGLPLLIYSVLSGETDTLYRVGRWGCGLVVRLAGVQLDVQGRERIPADRAVVFMPNHQSNVDPPAIISVLPVVRVLPKKEVFQIPILGRAMRLRGFIPVDRKNRERARQALDEAVEALQAGHSFLVFPEGTRSPDGRLLPFKKGAFIMAMRAQAEIVPISISGASRIMRKGEWTIRPGTVRITFHDPISTAGWGEDERGEVVARVRAAIITGLGEEEWPEEKAAAAAQARAPHGRASGGRDEIATRHGFARADVDGETVVYEHPEKGTLHTFVDGSWKLVRPGGAEASGRNATDLAEHLEGMTAS